MRVFCAPLALTLLAGCQFTTDGVAPVADGSLPRDGAIADARVIDGAPPTDGGALDGKLADAAVDAAIPDAALMMPGIRCTKTAVTDRATSVDLTTEGVADWVHFGMQAANDVDRKITGGGQISFAVNGPPGQKSQYVDNITGFTWTDGMPNATNGGAGPTHTGIYIPGNTHGFTLTVASDGASHKLRLYLGGFRSTGALSAMLSDGSGSCADNTSGDMVGSYNVTYELDYRSGPNATLTVTWAQSADFVGGTVSLESATLQ